MEADRPALTFKSSPSWVLALAAVLAFTAPSATQAAQAAEPPQRVAFQISTGTTGGSYFPVGEVLASLLSHPPGVGRCETVAIVCGPPGLIVSTRASEGSIANVLA